jgi:MYXO-CTERM domain-containing protein
MTRAAFALWILFLSPLTFAQDATIDSAASDSGADSEDTDASTDGTEQGAADLAGELGGCQGCASGEGVGGRGLSAAALGLLLVGLSRRR